MSLSLDEEWMNFQNNGLKDDITVEINKNIQKIPKCSIFISHRLK